MTNVLQALNVNGFSDLATVGGGGGGRREVGGRVACQPLLLSAHACQTDLGGGGANPWNNEMKIFCGIFLVDIPMYTHRRIYGYKNCSSS